MRRNKFSLSNYKIFTGNMGNLIPIGGPYEVLPGDTFRASTSLFVRAQKLLHPIMHPVRIRVHHWFVPATEIWEDFEEFITGGEDGTSTPSHPVIDLNAVAVAESSLLDYLGIPPGTYPSSTYNINALPVRGYQMIYDDWYRDQDIITSPTIDITSGTDSTTDTDMKTVAWEKDRFTSARSSGMKGSQVTIPLGADAAVVGDGNQIALSNLSDGSGNQPVSSDASGKLQVGAASATMYGKSSGSGLVADLSAATGVDIDDLETALATQSFQERMQAFGSRYVEYLKFLGIMGSGRINRCDYLGGGSNTIAFSEILSTDGANTGDMYGHGISAMRTNRFIKFFREHGFIFTLMSVVPKSIYGSGINKLWGRSVKEDYYQHEFANLGEQEVLNREIYWNHTTPGGTHGFQERYDSYRGVPSTIAGEFRSTRNDWHMARIFASDTALNSSFINCSPTTRIYGAPSTDQLICMAQHSVQARRMMPVHPRRGRLV